MCRQSQKFLRSKRRCWGLLSGSCLKHSALFISWKKVFHDVESTWCWCCVIRNVPLVFALSVLSSNCKNSPQFLLPGHRPPFTRLDINKINPCGVHPWLALLYVKSELQKIEFISLNNMDQSTNNLLPLKTWTSSILGSSVLHGNG